LFSKGKKKTPRGVNMEGRSKITITRNSSGFTRSMALIRVP